MTSTKRRVAALAAIVLAGGLIATAAIATRYKQKFPGSHVKFVLTPVNNAQFTAQIAAAFASRRVPDVMLVYSGGYTTPYMLSSLDKLNSFVDQTPGFYKTQTAWDLSCLGLNCK